MTDFKHDTLNSLPKPAKSRGGAVKLGMLTLTVLLMTGAGLYWLSRDEEDKEKFTATVKENVDSAVKDTPFQQVVDNYLEPKKPSLAVPSTAPGTLAGQSVQGQMSAPPSSTQATSPSTENILASSSGQNATTNTNTVAEGETGMGAGTNIAPEPITPLAPKVQQDKKVPLTFVDDMASWLVGRYHPQKGLRLSLSSANMRYGQKMHTLMPEDSQDTLGARADLLRYAFNSSMMSALYNLYAERFVQSMQEAAQKPMSGQSTAQPEKVLQAFAQEFSTLGSTLQGIGTLPDFSQRMQNIKTSVEETLRIHNELTEAVFAFDTAVEEKNTEAADTWQLRIDGLNAQYQRSIHDRTLATESLLSAIRKKAPAANRMDADTILFISEWLERRVGRGYSSKDMSQSAQKAGELLQNLSQKLRSAQPQEHAQVRP